MYLHSVNFSFIYGKNHESNTVCRNNIGLITNILALTQFDDQMYTVNFGCLFSLAKVGMNGTLAFFKIMKSIAYWRMNGSLQINWANKIIYFPQRYVVG